LKDKGIIMERLRNAIKLQAGRLDARVGQPRFGVITSVDVRQALARVELQPDGVLTGWLPILSTWAGAGWGMVCLPSPGDQVFVLPQEGSADHGVIVGSAYSDQRQPPKTELGELWLVHKSGSAVKLTNDGLVKIEGDLHVSGEISDRHGALGQLREVYNHHTHRVSTGATTHHPDQQD
jgi:phage baseplate assembly protein gpV